MFCKGRKHMGKCSTNRSLLDQQVANIAQMKEAEVGDEIWDE